MVKAAGEAGQEAMIEVNHAEEGLQLLLRGSSGKITDSLYPFAEGIDAGRGDVVAKERDLLDAKEALGPLDHHAGLVKGGKIVQVAVVVHAKACTNSL